MEFHPNRDPDILKFLKKDSDIKEAVFNNPPPFCLAGAVDRELSNLDPKRRVWGLGATLLSNSSARTARQEPFDGPEPWVCREKVYLDPT